MKILLYTAFAVAATYLVFSFNAVSFDISTWSEYARSGCATAMGGLTLIGAYVKILLDVAEGI